MRGATGDGQRPIERWFAHYADDHRDALNQKLHVVCVPLILWSVIALLWCIPVPGTLFGPGAWAALAMFMTWSFYYRHSRPLGMGMLAVFVLLAWSTRALHLALGPGLLAALALGVFVLAWLGQFIGHHHEGRRPSFLTDLTYLLIGPLWVLNKLYRRLGWNY
ncbi:Mpo1 family 2-hydroxy fatty acid dioxygenase [Luteimonas sp. e5]